MVCKKIPEGRSTDHVVADGGGARRELFGARRPDGAAVVIHVCLLLVPRHLAAKREEHTLGTAVAASACSLCHFVMGQLQGKEEEGAVGNGEVDLY